MTSIEQGLPLDYRHEEIGRVLQCIRAGDSCSIVGVSGMAKSNLFRHLLNPEVRQHYLGDAWQSYLFLALDSHALGELSERAMVDLILHHLVTEARERGVDETTMSRMETLHEPAAGATASLAWQQIFSQAVAAVMTADRTRHLVFLFDQFDEVCETLNSRFFANLRAIRDKFKYRISYVTFTRDELPRLCQAPECGEFYELLSPNVIGLGPYNQDDSWVLLRRVAGRYDATPDPVLGDRLIAHTGGHPGLLKAAYMATLRGSLTLSETDSEAIKTLLTDADVHTECLKLWQSVGEDEQATLTELSQRTALFADMPDVSRRLLLKGLVNKEKNNNLAIFSPLFAHFVSDQKVARPAEIKIEVGDIRIDAAGDVWVGQQKVHPPLTNLEFRLLSYFCSRSGGLCSRDDIIQAIYPDDIIRDTGVSDSRVDTLVSRLRKRIEPNPSKPRYIATVSRRGYKLIADESERTPC